MSPPINRATDPVSRAQMRLEYRLINLLGESRYGEVQPLLQALLKAKEETTAPASLPRMRSRWITSKFITTTTCPTSMRNDPVSIWMLLPSNTRCPRGKKSC